MVKGGFRMGAGADSTACLIAAGSCPGWDGHRRSQPRRRCSASTSDWTWTNGLTCEELRRNQQDVLTELLALQQTDEWEELSASDEDAYREAVSAGNFMAMRRAAYARPEKSAKLDRLREIVEDAAENGLKVVVFSNFRESQRLFSRAATEAAASPPAQHRAAPRRPGLVGPTRRPFHLLPYASAQL